NPAGNDQPNVAVPQIILSNRLEHRFGHGRNGHWDLQANRPRRVPQPLEVRFQTEHPAIVKPNAFKNSVAIKQTMVKHRDFGVLFGKEFAVDVNLRVFDSPPSLSLGSIDGGLGRFSRSSSARLRFIQDYLAGTIT